MLSTQNKKTTPHRNLRARSARNFFVALIASLLFAADAQADVTTDIDALLDKAATENADGNYVDAEMHYKQALRTSVSGMGAMSSMAGKLARELGNYYAKRGQYGEAEHYLLRSLIVTSGYSDGLADSEGDFRNVRTFLSQAIQKPESLGASIETANSLGSLADLYRRMGRYADAERMLQRVVQIYGGSSNNNQYFGADARKVLEETQLSLGQVLVKQGKTSEAEVVYKAYVENVRKHYGNSPKVADALNHLSSFYKGQDRSSESDAADAEAKEIMSQFR